MHCYLILSNVWDSNYSEQGSIASYLGMLVFTILYNYTINNDYTHGIYNICNAWFLDTY